MGASSWRRLGLAVSAVVVSMVAAGCAHTPSGQDTAVPAPEPRASSSASVATVAPVRPLRPGERRTTLRIPTDYTPSPPTGVGTDDYRCFLLDPNLPEDAWLTGTDILPGTPAEVHHVILYRIDSSMVDAAQAQDDASADPGWTCFGGMGLEGEFDNLDDAAWLGAWAPGGRETVTRSGYGVPLDRSDRIVMQVHYNLRAGQSPDRSATRIRWRPRAGSDVKAIHTVLLPAPVELPCRPEHAAGQLCTHDASVADAKRRFGEDTGQLANLLHLLCRTPVVATATTTCTRGTSRSMTVLGAAGHMHLLGRWIKIAANPGTRRHEQLLDIPVWDFDNQQARPVKPLHLEAGDTLRVTCHHDQSLRDVLPALQGTEEKYVVWGEGTTDEMCLGILQVVFDDESR